MGLEAFCMYCLFVIIMYFYVSWHYEHLRLGNRYSMRNETSMAFVNTLLTSDVHSICQFRVDRRTFTMLCELLHILKRTFWSPWRSKFVCCCIYLLIM